MSTVLGHGPSSTSWILRCRAQRVSCSCSHHIRLTQGSENEVSGEEAYALIKAGCKYVAEGSNMGSTLEAIEKFEEARTKGGLWYAPGKASNCGGVAVSALEMAQNSQRLKWTSDDVDKKLFDIMANCYQKCYETAKEL
jgi:glutamate dehydrogenase (NADP+)